MSFAANADIDVSINGVTLVAGTDYNTTTANTVGGLSALTAGQVVEIVIYEKFQLADALSKAAGGNIGGALGVGTIKEATGTTTAMTIDSTGRILTPARPAFRGTIGTVGVADYTTETTLTSFTEDYDIGGIFNHSTGIFTAPITGLYQINYFGAFNGAAAATNLNFKLIKGSSTEVFVSQTDPQGGGQETIGASLTLSLTASDTFKLNLLSGTDPSVGIKNIDFSGFLVG